MSHPTYYIAGVDEAGRGPLAGPVVAAAVVLDNETSIPNLTDSKKLTAQQRQQLAAIIKTNAIAWAIGRAEVAEIDQINILQASLLAMKRAVLGLTVTPSQVLVDGKFCPDLTYPCQAIIKGDLTEPAISAASILAKVTRDHEMLRLEQQFPGYDFAQHKGYPTKAHLTLLKENGPCPIHRRSFGPVKKLINLQQPEPNPVESIPDLSECSTIETEIG